MNNLRTIGDRLAGAIHATSLAWDPERVRDIDYLTALGMVGVSRPTATRLYRLVHQLDAASYREALALVVPLVRRLAIKKRWKLKPHHFGKLAKDALEYVIMPLCPTCQGRRFQSIAPGIPALSARVCPACGGAGVRKVASNEMAVVIGELEDSLFQARSGVSRMMR